MGLKILGIKFRAWGDEMKIKLVSSFAVAPGHV